VLPYRDNLLIPGRDEDLRDGCSVLLSILRGINIRDMFALIRLGDLGIFRTVAEFGRSKVSSYLDDLLLLSHDECPKCNTEVTQG
jgi:hypothetical protein